MKFKKRKKSGRRLGNQTAFRGAKERTRHSGNRGGYGMAGTGKRADQKKTLVINLTGGNNYFGKSKTLRRGRTQKRLRVINLNDISLRHAKTNAKEISLIGYKILGDGELAFPITIKASAASPSAQEKIKKSGSTLILPDKKP